jgi:serine protease Do
VAEQPTTAVAELDLPDFAALVENTHRSVVDIAASHALPFPQDLLPRREQSIWRALARSLGAGFALGEPGHLVTCASVVQDADEITVILANGRRLDAEVVATDELSDIALLAVDPALAPPPLPVGAADSLRVGDWVVAFGYPFGLAHSVTSGIVSAIRTRDELGSSHGLILSDAAIHPGNNGGPLIDIQGRVVGINLVRGAPSDGLGLALPIHDALAVVEALRQGQAPSHGWLGISVQYVDAALAASFDLPGTEGAVVTRVTPGSPAQRAGLQVGDVVLALGEHKIQDPLALIEAAKRAPIGRKLPIRIARLGKRKTLQIRPESAPPASPRP